MAEWLKRWDAACARSWMKLESGTPSEAQFRKWERSHVRLLRLIEAKQPGIGGRICLPENYRQNENFLPFRK